MKSQEKPTIYVFDKLIIGYCLFMVLLLLAVGRPMRQYFDEVLFYASMATLVALIIRFVPEHKNRLQIIASAMSNVCLDFKTFR